MMNKQWKALERRINVLPKTLRNKAEAKYLYYWGISGNPIREQACLDALASYVQILEREGKKK